MSALHTTEGVRPIMLPPSASGRRDLAMRMRAAINSAQRRISKESPSYPRGRFECARLLAALVEHCSRLYSDAPSADGAEAPVFAPARIAIGNKAAVAVMVSVSVDGARSGPSGSLDDIVKAAAMAFEVERSAVRPIKTPMRRFKAHSAARHVAMWCAFHRAGRPPLSICAIGKWFGGFDHTSVIYALRRIDREIDEGSPLGIKAMEVAEAAGVTLDKRRPR